MLTREQNERLTRVGPGTPMGELMRRYWLPALLSWELPEADCPPVRLRLLCEDLIAFRDTQGRIGVLDEFCAHRSTSLWLGRNEENGLRCVWHGWKYDVTGQCVDQMNEPGERSFAAKIRLKAYATVEVGDVVWVYMGPSEKAPPPPLFDWTQAPETHMHVNKVIQDCNWLQALEGGMDHTHVAILHREFNDPRGANRPDPGQARTFDVDPTDYGMRYAVIGAPRADGLMHVGGYHFVMPFTQVRNGIQRWTGTVPNSNSGHMWVPIDDEHCMAWNRMHSYGEPLTEDDKLEHRLGNGPLDVDQRTFQSNRNRQNDWLIDRQAQRTKNFTGIEGVNTQDRAVQELQGPIVDRTKEHLGPVDRAIIVAREVLLDAIETVEKGGDPPGTGRSYYHVRAASATLPSGVSWREALVPQMYTQGELARVG